MRKTTKDSFLEIKNNFKRFISLLLIVLLGVGFFAGVRATSPDMKKTIDTYFDQQDVMDIQVMSTLGITENDLDVIRNLDGVKTVEGAYSKDTLLIVDEKEIVAKVHSLGQLNKVELVEGRLPENENECVVEQKFLSETEKNIGDNITLKDEDDFFSNLDFTIVGTVKSPLYISNERGSTKLGAGKINYYVYIPVEAVDSEVYTECNVLVEGAKELLSLNSNYTDKIEQVKEKIEEIAIEQKEKRYNEIKDDIYEELADAEKTLEEEKEKAYKEISDAEEQIKEAKKEVSDKEEELNKSEQKANQEFNAAKQKLKEGNEQLQKSKEEFENAKKQGLEQIEEANVKLKQLQQNRDDLKNGVQEIENGISSISNNIKEVEIAIENLQTQIENSNSQDEVTALEQQLNELQEKLLILKTSHEQLSLQKQQLEGNLQQVETGIKTIEDEIEKGTNELNEGEKKLKLAEQELNEQTSELEKTILTTNAQFAEGRKQLEDAKDEINENENLLEEEKQKAEEEIQKAQNEIDDARDEINNLKKPEWYVLDRDSNYGYAQFSQDTERIANIGKVFPVVFFVVAALISLNSMTRMVEEQRVQIGTLKALGYSRAQIIKKYIIYAILATVIGSVIGMAIGFQWLPKLIFDMYATMYVLPDIIIELNWEYAITGFLFASICTVGATIYSSIRELRQNPAELMRAKAPKSGKKVFLEKIKFIWSRLKFTQKVTARNIFRYKKRFMMTIIGILGCTSLILAGFGLKDSIETIIPSQYGEIFKYQLMVNFKEDITREEIQNQTDRINKIEEVTDSLNVNMQAVSITNKENNQDIQLVVPSECEKLEDFIQLKNKKSGEKYKLDNTGVVITEKLADLLEVKQGDTITLKNADDIESNFIVSNITENYIMHYIYMSPELYSASFGENAKWNVLLSKTNELNNDQEDTLGKEILEDSVISSVSFSTVTKGSLDDVMKNLSLVVGILIISAGLLAFVVLYNLANVNISERIRELATIKVLGFYDAEVYKYINRETTILTIIGIIVGLVAGTALNMYILKTCELDSFMFNPTVKTISYFYAIGITLIFTFIVNIFTYYALKKINMVESLKSIE